MNLKYILLVILMAILLAVVGCGGGGGTSTGVTTTTGTSSAGSTGSTGPLTLQWQLNAAVAPFPLGSPAAPITVDNNGNIFTVQSVSGDPITTYGVYKNGNAVSLPAIPNSAQGYKIPRTLLGNSPVSAASITESYTLLNSSNAFGTVDIWNIASGQFIGTYSDLGNIVLSKDGSYALAANFQQSFSLISKDGNRSDGTFQCPTVSEVLELSNSGTGAVVLTGDTGKQVPGFTAGDGNVTNLDISGVDVSAKQTLQYGVLGISSQTNTIVGFYTKKQVTLPCLWSSSGIRTLPTMVSGDVSEYLESISDDGLFSTGTGSKVLNGATHPVVYYKSVLYDATGHVAGLPTGAVLLDAPAVSPNHMYTVFTYQVSGQLPQVASANLIAQ